MADKKHERVCWPSQISKNSTEKLLGYFQVVGTNIKKTNMLNNAGQE